ALADPVAEPVHAVVDHVDDVAGGVPQPVHHVAEPAAVAVLGGAVLLLDVLLQLAGAVLEPGHHERLALATGAPPLLAEGVGVGPDPGARPDAAVEVAEQSLEALRRPGERFGLSRDLLGVHALEAHQAALPSAWAV